MVKESVGESPLNERHCLSTRARVFTESAEYGRCYGHGPGLFDASEGHAGVFSLNDDHDADGGEFVEESFGDLLCHTLLNLQPAGEYLGDPGEFGEANDAAVLWDIGDVAFACERGEMV